MPTNRHDITGRRFGRLVVQAPAETAANGCARWECECDCGTLTIVKAKHLKAGATRSCGCLRRDTNTALKGTHCLSHTAEYRIWRLMKYRCQDKSAKSYVNYGGRGIDIDPRWEAFETFYQDMGPRPSEKHTLERVDNDRGYSPENCVWATRVEQMRNQRPRKGNTTGVPGVVRHRSGGFEVCIGVGGKRRYVGYYSNLLDAFAARKSAENKLWR